MIEDHQLELMVGEVEIHLATSSPCAGHWVVVERFERCEHFHVRLEPRKGFDDELTIVFERCNGLRAPG